MCNATTGGCCSCGTARASGSESGSSDGTVQLTKMRVSSSVFLAPASPEAIERALEIALGRLDSVFNDAMAGEVKNIVLAHAMAKRAHGCTTTVDLVRTKQVYQAFRETDPDTG